MKARVRTVVLLLRLGLATYLFLGAVYKVLHPAAATRIMEQLPLLRSAEPWALRGMLGLVVAAELSIGLCLVANRRVREASFALVALLMCVTVFVSPLVGPTGCDCNWSWVPLSPGSPREFIARNGFLAVVALVLSAVGQRLPSSAPDSGA